MGTTIKELITKFGFEVDKEPLEKVEHSLEQIKGRLEFLAAAEILKSLYELGEKFAHFAEELHVAATSAGLTVEAFQKLAFAAGQSAVSQEELGGAMARLGRHLYEARMGSEEAQKAFMQAGFSAEQVRGFHNAGDAMAALADQFKGIQDPIQKQALAMQLLGRGSVNMVGFLSQGSAAIKGLGNEAEKLGIILSDHQVEALVETEHALNKLWGVFKAFGATVAVEIAPIIKSLVKNFLEFYEANHKVIEQNVREWARDLAYALGFIHGLVQGLVEVFLSFSESHQKLIRRVFEFALALGILVGVIFTLQKAIGIITGAFGLLGSALAPMKFLWEKAFWPAIMLVGQLVKTVLANLFLSLATLVETALPAVAEAFLAMGAAIEATPVGLIVTALAALVVVLHDVYTLLFGSGKWEDTWIAKAFNAVKGFGGKALSFLGLGEPDKPGAENSGGQGAKNLSDVADKKSFLDQASQNLGNIQSFGSVIPAGFGGSGGQSSSSSQSSYQVNAPVNIEINGHADPKAVGDKVKEGISDHLDKVYRRTQQSLRPAQNY